MWIKTFRKVKMNKKRTTTKKKHFRIQKMLWIIGRFTLFDVIIAVYLETNVINKWMKQKNKNDPVECANETMLFSFLLCVCTALEIWSHWEKRNNLLANYYYSTLLNKKMTIIHPGNDCEAKNWNPSKYYMNFVRWQLKSLHFFYDSACCDHNKSHINKFNNNNSRK